MLGTFLTYLLGTYNEFGPLSSASSLYLGEYLSSLVMDIIFSLLVLKHVFPIIKLATTGIFLEPVLNPSPGPLPSNFFVLPSGDIRRVC
jgi:hypothetical protein